MKSLNTKAANENLQVLSGRKPVMELLSQAPQRIRKICCRKNAAHGELETLRDLCQKHDIDLEIISDRQLDELCSGSRQNHVNHQGLAALLAEKQLWTVEQIFELIPDSPLPLALALDQIQDPGNLGTLCRTAYALGLAGAIIPKHGSSCLGPAAMRSSAGALEKFPVAVTVNLARALDAAEEIGLHIYGACCTPPNQNSAGQIVENALHHDWRLPAILVLGNENKGIRPGVAKRCNTFISIPLAKKFDSLNIAQAGAILLGLCAARHNG